ncbi:MAG: cyclopropane-fatty-acyl-phospholipid synthase family protein [Candidatus Bipolaricaulia bacterium]
MAWIAGVTLGALSLLWLGWNLTLDALWQPTDRVTVRRILLLSAIRPGERMVDLGCGDGRIVIAAARHFGAHAVGVEIDPFRVCWARLAALFAGVPHRARIVHGNMYTYDLRESDVVVLFLSATSNFKLQERLKSALRAGSRVVSYYHPMWGWEPDVIGEARDGYPIYVYRMRGADDQAPA